MASKSMNKSVSKREKHERPLDLDVAPLDSPTELVELA